VDVNRIDACLLCQHRVALPVKDADWSWDLQCRDPFDNCFRFHQDVALGKRHVPLADSWYAKGARDSQCSQGSFRREER